MNLAEEQRNPMSSFLETLTTESPQILVMIIVSITSVGIVVAAALSKRRDSRPGSDNRRVEISTAFQDILSNPTITDAIQRSSNPDDFVIRLLNGLEESPIPKQQHWTGIFYKMLSDITWDVAGLIGIFVTIALLIMMIARQVEGIPKEIFAGWTTILGFYFGKAATAAGSGGHSATGGSAGGGQSAAGGPTGGGGH